MIRSSLRCAAPGALLSLFVLVPFLGKAFTIDDPLFLCQASHVLSDPLHPSAVTMVWSEFPVPMRVSDIVPSGPVMAYLLVPSILLGGSETVAHLVQAALLVLSILAIAALALRLGLAPKQVTTAAALLAATPCALAMAGTAMPDVPAMAFGVVAVERLMAWRHDGRWHQAATATMAFALAMLSRPHLILLLGVGALALADDIFDRRTWRLGRRQRWIPLVMAPALALAVVMITRDPQATRGLSGAARVFSSSDNVLRNLVSFAVHWMLVLPLGVPWMLLRPGRVVRRPVLYAATVAALVSMRLNDASPRFFIVAAIAGLGAAVLWDLLSSAWQRKDSVQLVLGLWLLTPLCAVFYIQLPSKLLLAAAPAAAILVAREMANAPRAVARAVLLLTLAMSVTLAVMILRTDAAFAALGKRAAAEMIAPNAAQGRRVWFDGHWGFQWYAERAGGRALTATPPFPVAGDLVVSSPQAFGFMLRRLAPHYRRLALIEEASPGGRLTNWSAYAGFFTNRTGDLPWSWSSEPLAQYEVVVIER